MTSDVIDARLPDQKTPGMRPTDLTAHLFTANATVLLAHQVDAAYWREWELFAIPGGIQVFVLLNLPIIAVVLHGVRALALGRPSGVRLSWLLVASGAFAAVFHTGHLLNGDDAFRAPVSVALLACTAVLSLLQAVVLTSTAGPWRGRASALTMAPARTQPSTGEQA